MGKETTRPDEIIIQWLKEDKEKAIDMLFSRYYLQLLKLARHLVEDRMQAEEIVQEMFINIWEKRHSLKLKDPINPYLKKAVINRCMNFLRSQKYRSNILIFDQTLLEEVFITPRTDEEIDAPALRKAFVEIRRLLPDKTKTAFLLSRKLGMSYKEIAKHMGISQKGVEKHISKALVTFRMAHKKYLRALFPLILAMYEIVKH